MSHRRLDVQNTPHHPAYVVWELTLACDHACTHCGSRAGVKRETELSTTEALRVVRELRELGTREVVLIGGEAYLHEGFLEVVSALRQAGIVPTLTTGGRGVTKELAQAMKAAGMGRVSVSIDGLEERHDTMRNLRGSYTAGMSALDHLREAGLPITSNINLNRLNHRDLEGLYPVLRDKGIVAWQVQLTTPLGRAADRTELIFQPWELLDLLPRIAALKIAARKDGIVLMPGNNLGYFGPEEATLRSLRAEDRDHFAGCQAGKFVLGLESDGAVKGCPSLQTSHYVGGHVPSAPLRELWENAPELAFARRRTPAESLWGFCQSCPFAEVCMGGCTFTAHALLGRPGNNPYCHYRAQALQKEGLRERLVPREAASGLPFDCGTFELVTEPFDAPQPKPVVANLVQITRPANKRGPCA